MMGHSLYKVCACLGSSSKASSAVGSMDGGASDDPSMVRLHSDDLAVAIATDRDKGSCKPLAFPCKGQSCNDEEPCGCLSSVSSYCYYSSYVLILRSAKVQLLSSGLLFSEYHLGSRFNLSN